MRAACGVAGTEKAAIGARQKHGSENEQQSVATVTLERLERKSGHDSLLCPTDEIVAPVTSPSCVISASRKAWTVGTSGTIASR